MSIAATIHVATCVSEAYLMPTAVAFRSIAETTSSPLHFHLATPNANEEALKRVRDSIPSGAGFTHWPITTERLDQLSVSDHFHVIGYARILLPEILPSIVKKVLYVDADLIARQDISELYETTLDGFPLAAVQDQWGLVVGRAMVNWRDAGMRAAEPYFNAGVLLMDLDHWRREDLSETVLTYARDHAKGLRFADQCALNGLLYERWKPIPAKFNVQRSLTEPDEWRSAFLDPNEATEATVSPVITHYAGKVKPWSVGAQPSDTPEWFEILDRTSWRGWRPEGKPVVSIATKLRRRTRRVLEAALVTESS
jgi:lipopolysaccharide biosynthesis glycosyltransferase